ncbi:hypothetical protein niasHT_013165 [Heterodera trifolii]|uniref:Uncharacterized protein n=1 Tax=Heterodera trifolii TaxID=157864 RepID=A0ABD2KTQ9_9BILA
MSAMAHPGRDPRPAEAYGQLQLVSITRGHSRSADAEPTKNTKKNIARVVQLAQERIANQLPNTERIARSNVVFCSLWDYSETERQVQKALNNVKERLRENDS